MGKIVAIVVFMAILGCILLALQFANVFASWGWGSAGAYDKARTYWRSGDAESALYWCDVAIRRNPKWPPPYELRAEVLCAQGKLKLAAQEYIRAGDALHYISYEYAAAGTLYEKLGEIDTAAGLYSRVILSNSKQFRGLEMIGKIRAGRDDPDGLTKLRHFMAEAAQRNPGNEQIRKASAILHDLAKQTELCSPKEESEEPPEEPEEEG